MPGRQKPRQIRPRAARQRLRTTAAHPQGQPETRNQLHVGIFDPRLHVLTKPRPKPAQRSTQRAFETLPQISRLSMGQLVSCDPPPPSSMGVPGPLAAENPIPTQCGPCPVNASRRRACIWKSLSHLSMNGRPRPTMASKRRSSPSIGAPRRSRTRILPAAAQLSTKSSAWLPLSFQPAAGFVDKRAIPSCLAVLTATRKPLPPNKSHALPHCAQTHTRPISAALYLRHRLSLCQGSSNLRIPPLPAQEAGQRNDLSYLFQLNRINKNNILQ